MMTMILTSIDKTLKNNIIINNFPVKTRFIASLAIYRRQTIWNIKIITKF